MNEQSELRRIVQSRAAQKMTRLVTLLQKEHTKHGVDWFSYLCRKMEQRHGPVFTLPIKEIQDSLDPDQKAIFKGYGKDRTNSRLDAEDTARAKARAFGAEVDDDQNDDDYDDDEDDAVNSQMAGLSERDHPHFQQKAGELGYKMDMMLETMVDENRRTQQLLGKLIGALTGATEEPEPKKAAPKPRRARVPGKKAQQEVHAE